jgi:hypothetical protein
MTKDEALKLALEALEYMDVTAERYVDKQIPEKAITAIKAALEAKDEPVAYINVEQRKLEWAKYMSWDTPTVVNLPKIPLYTTPPQRTWVGLTRIELIKCGVLPYGMSYELYEAIEQALKEKNK